MNRVNFHQLQYFVTIAEAKSFRKAAEQLYVAQPALSYGISTLENTLGTRLFIRGKGKLSLTPAGEVFLEEAKIILKHVNLAYQKVHNIANQHSGELRICCLGFLMTLCFSDVISPFLSAQPEINVLLEQDYLEPMNQRLERREADILITRATTVDKKRHPGIMHKTLFHDELYLVVAKQHPLASLSSIDDMSVLAEEPFITLDPGVAKEFHARICNICKRKNYVPNIAHTASTIDILYTQIAAKMGISVLPRFKGYFDRNLDLVYIPILHDEDTANDVVALWDETNSNPHVKTFVDFLESLNLD